MFATSTRIAALAMLLAAALPAVMAGTPTDKRDLFNLGGLTVDLAPASQEQAQAVEPVVAASLGARVKARSLKRRDAQYHLKLCPQNFEACALPSGSFECLDVTQELSACGACLEKGGMNCEQIPNVDGVSCAAGKCEIHSCLDGYRPNIDKTACVSMALRHRRRH